MAFKTTKNLSNSFAKKAFSSKMKDAKMKRLKNKNAFKNEQRSYKLQKKALRMQNKLNKYNYLSGKDKYRIAEEQKTARHALTTSAVSSSVTSTAKSIADAFKGNQKEFFSKVPSGSNDGANGGMTVGGSGSRPSDRDDETEIR